MDAIVRKVPVRPTPAEQCTKIGVCGVGERRSVDRVKASRCDGESGTPAMSRSQSQRAARAEFERKAHRGRPSGGIRHVSLVAQPHLQPSRARCGSL